MSTRRIVILLCLTFSLGGFTASIAAKDPPKDDVSMTRALSFACGYMSALRDAQQQPGTPGASPNHEPVPQIAYCAAERQNAKAHGFDPK